MIDEEARRKLTELAMRVLDALEDEYGQEARLEDAVLCFEVSVPADDGDGEITLMNGLATTDRAPVAGGIAQSYANRVLFPERDA